MCFYSLKWPFEICKFGQSKNFIVSDFSKTVIQISMATHTGETVKDNQKRKESLCTKYWRQSKKWKSIFMSGRYSTLHCLNMLFLHEQYRVFRIKLKHLIWLKMTLKIIADIKTTYFYNHKDPPFDMKHQLMSADPVPVVKIDLR